MRKNGRRIGEKDGTVQAITACLSGRGRLFTMGLMLFVVLGGIGCLGVGAVAGANERYPANVVVETSVSPLEVSLGDWIEISVVVENVGEKAITNNNGSLRIGICDPNEIEGHVIKEIRFDLNVSETKTFKIGWMVPETAPSGEYRGDAGASLYVGNIPYEITERTSKRSAYFHVSNVTEPATLMPTPTPPGFEAIFAIAGMLAVAYLVRRRSN